MTEKDPIDFIKGIVDDPVNNMPRLIYADWLDEQIDTRDELVRVECELSDNGLSVEKSNDDFVHVIPPGLPTDAFLRCIHLLDSRAKLRRELNYTEPPPLSE